MDIIIQQSIERLPYTHFLSIPLPALRQPIQTFFAELQKEFNPQNTPGFDPSIFNEPSHMHLTVLMLKLYTQEAVDNAVVLLKKCESQVYDLLQTRSLVVI